LCARADALQVMDKDRVGLEVMNKDRVGLEGLSHAVPLLITHH
jgi:hypothetical protein